MTKLPAGVLRVRKQLKTRPDSRFSKQYIVYQNGRHDAVCSVGVYRRLPSSNDYDVQNDAGVVVRFKRKMWALTPELGDGVVGAFGNPSDDDPVASSVLPDPVVMAALGSMSTDL